MGTLYGIIFMSHQLGSFMGVWWIGVGAFSALIHLPIRETARPLAVAPA
jgi:hypothetical protein